MSSPWSRHATTERPDAPAHDDSDDDAVADGGALGAPSDGGAPDDHAEAGTSGTSAGPATNGHQRTNGHPRAHEPDADGTTGPSPADSNGHALDDGEMSAAFRRPGTEAGSFAAPGDADPAAPTRRHDQAGSREPSVALASAFGRPQGTPETLQRPADSGRSRTGNEADDLWDAETTERDPWRDPSAAVELGAPAVREGGPGPDRRAPGPRLSARELLFGKRVAPSALVLLAVVALLVGAVGGVVGHLTAGGLGRADRPGRQPRAGRSRQGAARRVRRRRRGTGRPRGRLDRGPVGDEGRDRLRRRHRLARGHRHQQPRGLARRDRSPRHPRGSLRVRGPHDGADRRAATRRPTSPWSRSTS